jgi:hypothetical protein
MPSSTEEVRVFEPSDTVKLRSMACPGELSAIASPVSSG